jgi:hypothetical protein
MKKGTRGTTYPVENPHPNTLRRRARVAREAARVAALQSANEAGYRRGKDEQDRELNTRHDAEINVLRNQVVSIAGDTVALMDREYVKGWLASNAYFNETCPEDEIAVMSVNTTNAIARELTRAYDKEKQS